MKYTASNVHAASSGDILNKCSSLAPVNVKVDTDYYNMEAIKPKPIEGIREQKMI